MKLFGYEEVSDSRESSKLLELSEISLCVSPDQLRAIAGFMLTCADEMEEMGEKYDHVHLSDRVDGFALSPQLIVVSDAKYGDAEK